MKIQQKGTKIVTGRCIEPSSTVLATTPALLMLKTGQGSRRTPMGINLQ